MNFYTFVNNLLRDTLDNSLPNFRPELVLCATIVAMLLVRMPRWGHKINSVCIALPGVAIALYYAAPWNFLAQGSSALEPVELFQGMLIYDTLTVYFRSVLLVFALLFLVFTWLSGIPDREDSPDFYTLVLGATIGMCLMASSNHLFVALLGIEMASVPSYALAGILKGRRRSSEAALKYSVYGAGAAGVMLYGISLLGGALGSLHLPTMAAQLAALSPETLAERQTVLMLGGLMVSVGLAFKLSAVPFHFWCPDVFEGAAAEVNAFLSVASKAAALALLVRIAIGFSVVPPSLVAESPQQEQVTLEANANAVGKVATAETSEAMGIQSAPGQKAARHFIAGLIALLAAVSCTFGNLAAYGQTNLKRLLAYSTIAHAGYMMMPVAAAVVFLGDNPDHVRQAVTAVCMYVGIYMFMNLGAFAVVAFLRNTMRSEEIADYGGLIKSSPGVVLCLATLLVSLIGLPPLAGFTAKFAAFAPLAAKMQTNAYDPLLMTLLVIGGLNTVISLFYYLRVVKIMTIDPAPEDRLPVSFSLISAEGVFVVAMTAPVVALGVGWDGLHRWAQAAAQAVLS
ncbi:MAG: NADH-quinone oxidoreductase subunit N [Planctomycetes bacterium]|nr:NADH-quinone oxidoreductase subunit N [Planctomycetota bacterium]